MTDEQLEYAIGNLLRAGVLISAVLVAVGGLFYLIENHAKRGDYANFHAAHMQLRTLSGILSAAMHLQSDGLIQLGLVALIATPIARVGLSVLGFYAEGDRLYVSISLIVLVILAYSITHAF